jgi:anti-anti-sigma regulatory factor
VLNANTACLFTAVVGELTSPTVIIDVRHLIAADEQGLAVVVAEDDHRRARRGRLMLVGSPPWLQTSLREAGQQHLLPWIRLLSPQDMAGTLNSR